MENMNVSFEIETLQDWQVEAKLEESAPVLEEGGGASNSNSSNNSADEP